jgi:hypothetical protein
VVAGTPSFTAGGSSSITVTVKDGLGNPLGGVTVTLSSSVVGDVVTNSPSATDGSGVATGSVSATSAGPRTITAVAGGITVNQKPTLTVTASTADGGKTTVSASPTSIVAGGGSSTITVTVKDQYANLVSGSSVSLSTSGTNFTLTQPSGLTGSNGVATGSLSSTDPQTFTVSAIADGVPITQTASVTVTNQPPPGITQTLLTAGSDITNQRIYTTASIAPAANALITIAVIGHTSLAVSADPTITGGGVSAWTVVASTTLDPLATPHKRMTVYRAMSAAPGNGPITITFSTTQSNAAWIVSQWTGVDQTGSNGSGAIVQTKTAGADAVSSIATTLSPLGGPNNVAYGVVGTNGSAVGINPAAGFTKISEQRPAEGTASIIEALWAANQTAVSASWSGTFNAAIFAIEIKAGP